MLLGEGVACLEEEGPRDHSHWSRGHGNPLREGLMRGPLACPHLGTCREALGEPWTPGGARV